jgi:1-acyl-sn-glycerol-3-phosphate acyltransferase
VNRSTESSEPKKPSTHFDAHPEQRLSIKTLKLLDVLFARIYHRLTVHSPPQLPPTGPAIMICNHTSALDPMLIQSVCRRVIVWMMAKEYYEIRLMTPIFRALEVIPVDRGARDTSAMRSALRALQEGRILGVFPEGRIETTPELLPFQPGVAQMAIKTKVPVYPAYLDGTQRGMEVGEALMRRNESSIAFGPAVDFSRTSTSRENLDAATATLRAAVESLRAIPRRL